MSGGEVYVFNRFSGWKHRIHFRDDFVTSVLVSPCELDDELNDGTTFATFSEKATKLLDLFRDLNLDRSGRQKYYLEILRSLPQGETASPSEVKQMLEDQYNLTYIYIGQDMAPMRYWKSVYASERGRYSVRPERSE